MNTERKQTETLTQWAQRMRAERQATRCQNTPPAPPVVTPSDPPQVGIIESVQRVHNRNRIDLFYTGKPSDETIQLLKGNGFRYRPTDQCWYHADTHYNRLFVTTLTGFMFTETPTETPTVPPTETPTVPPTETPTVPPTETPTVASIFSIYRCQVDELLKELKLEPADLPIVAIAALHKATFSRDS